jgi:hypothetical protein
MSCGGGGHLAALLGLLFAGKQKRPPVHPWRAFRAERSLYVIAV